MNIYKIYEKNIVVENISICCMKIFICLVFWYKEFGSKCFLMFLEFI